MSPKLQENSGISQGSGKNSHISGEGPATPPLADDVALDAGSEPLPESGKMVALSEAEMAVCTKIAAFIKDTHLRTSHVAKAVGMSASSIDNVINFRNAPSAKMLIGLRNAYNLDMNETLHYQQEDLPQAEEPAAPYETREQQLIRTLGDLSVSKDAQLAAQQELITMLKKEISRLETINEHLKKKPN